MIAAHRRMKAVELHDTGMAVALAYHEPKRLSELMPKGSKATIDKNALPAMLRATS